jgi:ribosomal protein S18 acetylase RimI-like enzyme
VSRPSQDLIIRRISAVDGSLLRELRMSSLADAPDAFGQTVGQIRSRPSTDWRQAARQAAQGPGRSWFIAEADGEAVGIVQGRRRPPGTLLVFSMWVDERYRRRGIGRTLIERAESWGGEWVARETILWVLQANASAIEFYRDLGFEVVSTGEDAVNGARFEALALRRTIDPSS